MITHGEDVEIHALHKQGWSVNGQWDLPGGGQ